VPEKGIDRLWGVPGGFLDLVAVIIVEITGIEAGCWRGCCMIGRAMRDESRARPANSNPQPNAIMLALPPVCSALLCVGQNEHLRLARHPGLFHGGAQIR
jgi:hypothetical protein